MLDGPNSFINGVQHVEAVKGLVTYDCEDSSGGSLWWWRRRQRCGEILNGLRYVEAMKGLVTY